jgi:hypothetical protein
MIRDKHILSKYYDLDLTAVVWWAFLLVVLEWRELISMSILLEDSYEYILTNFYFIQATVTLNISKFNFQ